MKSFIFLPLLVLTGFIPGKSSSFINPTGTYRLKGVVKNNKVTGHSGELRVRLLDENTVALCFYINAGYPGYQSGSVLDTLSYEENKVEYRPVKDTGCSVYFYFDLRKVNLLQVMSDPRSGCGFDPGAFAPLVFPKVSSEIPIIQNLERKGN
ncbi:MAG: hypothetical protein JST68_11290 [Bacteroidetes bacterium]|nr:hypothetical protein [Bacteroidota bacterium]